uniref:DUF6493 family protein n=1 Tax=Flavobacterium sp. TaxID=239 RepID=UPI004049F6AB
MNTHLKYIDGTSDKFWKIEVSNQEFTVTYGKNGTSGVAKTKSFETQEACLAAAEKLVAEKRKKGYSEDGEVNVETKTIKTSNVKSEKKSSEKIDIAIVLKEYDEIIKLKDACLLLPFFKKYSKGNLDAIRKHIKKAKSYWMTFVDMSLEPGYLKTNENRWVWSMRGDEKTQEIIVLSAIAIFDKTSILTFTEVMKILNQPNKKETFEILQWAQPKWIESYILDQLRKQTWNTFDYKSLLFLEEEGFIEFNSELYALCLSSFNSWSGKAKPRDFISDMMQNERAIQRDIPLLYEYETNIQNSTFRENENASYRECNTWAILMKQLIDENKLDKSTFIEKAILIQTKDWNNNLKLFFRKILEDLTLTAEDLIPFQEFIFPFFHNSNNTIVNYGSVLVKQFYNHPKFKTKSYFEWVEALMMRDDCKTAIKNTLMIFEKLSKLNPKLNKALSVLAADAFIISDLNLQERASKLLLKIGSEKDTVLTEKMGSYVAYMQGNIKNSLHQFINDEALKMNEDALVSYEFKPEKVALLTEAVEIPKDWNEIMFLIGRFLSLDENIDSEIIMNVFIAQKHLFPNDYTQQLQPYSKQLENTYFPNVQKIYVRHLILNKISDKDIIYRLTDEKINTLKTLKLSKFLVQKVLQKNAEKSLLPLLSFPTHKPHWVAPKTLLERLIAYQKNKESIDMVDFSIAISRMPREQVEEAIPLLDQLEPEMKDLMRYCLGVSNEFKFNNTSVISKLFQKVIGSSQDAEKIALWAVAARTYHPNETFRDFDKTALSDSPFVASPFVPVVFWAEKYNEWKNYYTDKTERSDPWQELTYKYPNKFLVTQNFIYNLDLNPQKEAHAFKFEYMMQPEQYVYNWNSFMPQNNEPLACLLLAKSCKVANGPSNELSGFLNIVNNPGFKFETTSLLVFACCFFKEKKELRILASEVLINLIEKQAIDILLFADHLTLLIIKKYGVFLRFIDSISVIKDISPLHNAALLMLFEAIFRKLEFDEKLPNNFKKMVEHYLDLLGKTNQKPTLESIQFFEKYNDVNALKPLIKQIIN